jgi:hypothetical protein
MPNVQEENCPLLRLSADIVGALLTLSCIPLPAFAQDVTAPPAITTAAPPGSFLKATPEPTKAPQPRRPANQNVPSQSTSNSIGIAITGPRPQTAPPSSNPSNTAPLHGGISTRAILAAPDGRISNRSGINGTGVTRPGSGPGTIAGSGKPGAVINGVLIRRSR